MSTTEAQMRLRQEWLLNLPFLKQCFLLSSYQIKGHLAASSTVCLKILANIVHLVSSGIIDLGRSHHERIKQRKKLNTVLRLFSTKISLNKLLKSREELLKALLLAKLLCGFRLVFSTTESIFE